MLKKLFEKGNCQNECLTNSPHNAVTYSTKSFSNIDKICFSSGFN